MFHNRWNWIIVMNGYDTRIKSGSPPCCFNNQLPNLHCALKYIMYDAPKCTLQTLQLESSFAGKFSLNSTKTIR